MAASYLYSQPRLISLNLHFFFANLFLKEIVYIERIWKSHMSNYPKADATRRFLAVLIDNTLSTIISFLPIWGGIMAAGYILFRDGFDWPFMRRRSFGKQIMKLTLVRTQPDTLPDLRTSISRNWMLAVPPLASMLPFIHPVWIFPIGAIIWLVEGLKVIQDPKGVRFGDLWAKTQVIELSQAETTPASLNVVTKKTFLRKRASKPKPDQP